MCHIFCSKIIRYLSINEYLTFCIKVYIIKYDFFPLLYYIYVSFFYELLYIWVKLLFFDFSMIFETFLDFRLIQETHFSTTYFALYIANFQVTPKFFCITWYSRNFIVRSISWLIWDITKLSDCYDVLDKLDNLNNVFTSQTDPHFIDNDFFINAEFIPLSVYQKVFTFCRDGRRKQLLIQSLKLEQSGRIELWFLSRYFVFKMKLHWEF